MKYADVASPGKTCFNVFLLLECMSQQQNALFTTCNSQTLLFDDHGVWTKLVTENVTRFDVPPFDIDIPTSRVWTILDACGGMHNPPPRLVLGLESLPYMPFHLHLKTVSTNG